MAEQLSPLYGGWGTNGAAGLAKAIVKAKADLAIPLGINFDAGAGYELQILSPTVEAFEDFGEDVDGQVEIPNHHLRSRDRTVGSTSKVNIQDANLLKIRATYGYKMTVPLASDIIATLMTVADPDRAHYYAADPPRIPLTSTAVGRMQSAPRLDEAQLSIKTKLKPAGAGTVPPEDFTEVDAEELEEEITNPTDPVDPIDPTDPTDPVDEVECETTWEDERYNVDTTLEWYDPRKWIGALDAVKNVTLDFAEGLLQGIGEQASDLWNLIKNPGILKDMAIAFMENPREVLKGMIDGIVDDVDKVLNCGPADIGNIVGQNLSPVVILKIVGKLAKLTGNAKLSKYHDDLDNKIKCTASASFLAGTWVQTPAGSRPIESIALGDFLTARPEATVDAENQSNQVTALHGRTAPNYHRLTTSLGTINATDEHPFWVIDKGWIPAKGLKVDDRLATLNGEALLFENGFQNEQARVYNFSVDVSHTYFVAAGQDGGDALWVHNDTCWDIGDVELEGPIKFVNEHSIYLVGKKPDQIEVYIGKDGRVYQLDQHPMDPIDFSEITGQTLGKGPDSTTLGKNLESVGIHRPDNTAAHHIVAGGDPRAAAVRAILDSAGIDINEAVNGVFLPCSSKVACPPASTHSRIHTNVYYDALEERLTNVPTETIKETLREIAEELANGEFPY